MDNTEQLKYFNNKIDICVADLKSHIIEEEHKLEFLVGRFDKHLEIYAKNGKELEAVKTNQAWLMRFFWIFMTPIISGIVYLIVEK